MFVVVDVGNSNIMVGVYQGASLLHHFRVATHHKATADEYGNMLAQILERRGVAINGVEAVIVASVVPQLNAMFDLASERYFGLRPLFIGREIRVPMAMRVDRPNEVGADRIVNAYAAWKRFEKPLVLVDFGTATTFDAVSRDGCFLGGAIAPGVEIAGDALFRAAAQLPRVELGVPQNAIGTNTHDAVQSGLFIGYLGLVDMLVTRIRTEMQEDAHVVATGGLARFFFGASKQINEVDPFLTLDGLKLLYQHYCREA